MNVKLPPPEKIYEAWSALAANRVHLLSDRDAPSGEARVISSAGDKRYNVRWHDNVYESTDSATWWQGYPGYPVLAVLMLRGKLPYDRQAAAYFADVNWNKANREAGRDYALAVDNVLAGLDLDNPQRQKIAEAAHDAWEALQNLPVKTARYHKKIAK